MIAGGEWGEIPARRLSQRADRGVGQLGEDQWRIPMNGQAQPTNHVTVAYIMAAAFPQWGVLELVELLGTAERIGAALRQLPVGSLPLPLPAAEAPCTPATPDAATEAAPAAAPEAAPEAVAAAVPAAEAASEQPAPQVTTPAPAQTPAPRPHHAPAWWSKQPVGLIKDRLLSELWGHDYKRYSHDRQILDLPRWTFGRTTSDWSVLLTAWPTEQIETWLASLPARASHHEAVVALRKQLDPVPVPVSPAERGNWVRRANSIPVSRAEEERLIAEALAAGRVTVAPKRPSADYPATPAFPGKS